MAHIQHTLIYSTNSYYSVPAAKIIYLHWCSSSSETAILSITVWTTQVCWVSLERKQVEFNHECWDCVCCKTCLMYAGAGSEHLSKGSLLCVLDTEAISKESLRATGLLGAMMVYIIQWAVVYDSHRAEHRYTEVCLDLSAAMSESFREEATHKLALWKGERDYQVGEVRRRLDVEWWSSYLGWV